MQTSTVAPVTTLAKFEVQCHLCGETIKRGATIRLWGHYPNSKRRRWVHVDCHAPDEAHPVTVETTAEVPADLLETIAKLTARIESLEKSGAVRTIEVKRPDAPPVKIKGTVHPVFEEVLDLAAAREHIFLPGPAGCGKSHLAEQVAEALGLKFGFISCSAGMSESQLLGRMVPMGENGQFEFVGTQFLDCYENGGVFLFDEIDAADSNVLLVVNSALANGHLAVPSRPEQPVANRHPDFVCIAAANTFGRGADRQYVGRSELDESTLDRFRIGTVPMDYDEGLERALCPDQTLYGKLAEYRERMRANRLERVLSTRFVVAAYRAAGRGKSMEWIESKLFAGWRRDEIAKVKTN